MSALIVSVCQEQLVKYYFLIWHYTVVGNITKLKRGLQYTTVGNFLPWISVPPLCLPTRDRGRISDEPHEIVSPIRFITTPDPMRYKLRTCWRKYQVKYWNKLISSHYWLLRENGVYTM